MGKFYRFLSVFLLAACLLVPSFVPSKAYALAEACWAWNSCTSRSENRINVIALAKMFNSVGFTESGTEDAVLTALDEYEMFLRDSYCDSCKEQAKRVQDKIDEILADKERCKEICALARPQATAESCTNICQDNDGFIENLNNREREEVDECNELGYSVGEAFARSLYTYATPSGVISNAVTWGIGDLFDSDTLKEQAHENAVSAYEVYHALFLDNYQGEKTSLGVKYTDTLNSFLGTTSGCWLCPIFDMIFNSVNRLATNIYLRLRGLFLALLVSVSLFWLLWTVLRFITTIHGANVGEFLTKIFKGLLLIMVLAILLRASPSFVGDLAIDPFASLGSGLSSEILKSQGFGGDTTVFTEYSRADTSHCGNTDISSSRPQDVQYQICEKKEEGDAMFLYSVSEGENVKMMLSADLYNNMNCMLRRMSLELISGLALGAAMVGEGVSGGAGSVLPQWSVFFCGILVLFIFLVLFIAVPLKMIDILLRLAFVVILLPFFIVCMATPVTRAYSKKGWELFLSCWISLITLFLYLSLAMMLINQAFLMEI